MPVSLTTLRAQVRERADMTSSTFVTDTANSLDAIINAACGELYDFLVTKFEDYFVTSGTIALTASTEAYALSGLTQFYKLLGVDVLENGRYRSLSRFNFSERNDSAGVNASSLSQLRYQLRGSSLYFHPAPGVSGTARVWFVPRMSQLVNPGDTFDAINEAWAEFVILAAAIKCMDKEESDSSALRADLARIKRDIDEAAGSRHADGPARIVDCDGGASSEFADYVTARLGG